MLQIVRGVVQETHFSVEPDEKIFTNNILPSLCHELFTDVFSPFERRSDITLARMYVNVLQSEQS